MLHALWALLTSFGEIGIFALGGGDSMLKLIETAAVTNHHWITASQYSSLLAMTFLFPGLTAAKISGMVGYHVAGLAGLLVAVLALNLPGIILVAAGFTIATRYMDRPIVKKILEAMKFGAMAMIGAVLFDMMLSHYNHHKGSPLGVALTVGFFFGLEYFEIPVIPALLSFLVVYLGLFLIGVPI